MRVSLNWLKEYVDVPVGADELAEILTMLGLEIEAVERPGAGISKVCVGKILSIDTHPNADKLVVCQTDVGGGDPLQIVCGATNMKEGDLVPTAVVGATLAEGFEIGRRKMRGVESQGMMCSARELGIGEDHAGLLILEPGLAVGESAISLLGLDDVVFEIEVTPNRGDWASMIGVARELAAHFGSELRVPDVTIRESDAATSDLSSVTIENAELCPRYIGRVLADVAVGPSPAWMVQRLLAAGQRPINNIVDITNYILMETGHPLHAFDYDLLQENRIVVRNPRPGEKLTTLDGEVRALDHEMLIIADGRAPVAIAGIMGGGESEVGETTTTVFLESAYFEPTQVRRTARGLGMQTEASARFQRGADPEMAQYAINRTAMLMQELAGAKVAQGLLDQYPSPLQQNEVNLRYARANLLLGATVPGETQHKILTELGFEAITLDGDGCTVRVPTWRHDVKEEADLIEEVARLYGYDQIELTLAAVRPTEDVFAPHEGAIRALRRFLAGQGLAEFYNWTFSCAEDVQKAGLEDAYLDMVALTNPLSENLAAMRSSLIPGLLANLSRNVRHGVAAIRGFEVGPVYVPAPGQELPDEPPRVGVVLCGGVGERHWSRSQEPADFYDIKGYCEAILQHFGVAGVFEEAQLGTFEDGQCASVRLKKHTVGRLGQVRPSILEAYDIDQPAFLLELDLEPLLRRAVPTAQFEAIGAFPPSLRDLAVVVAADTPAGDIRDAALQSGGKLLKSVDIFDIYTGKQVPEGKKSVALSLVFQSDERTLTDKDTQKAWNKIVKKLESSFEAELR